MSLATEARQFLRNTQHGLLSTLSAKFAGFPYGSVTPFVLGHDGQPIILISTLAEHTKNIIADPKVSLLVFAKGDDLQANARLTLMGEAAQIEKNDADLMARYYRYFPDATGYMAMHDFQFYRIQIAQARYIAGFGKMGWAAGEEMADINNAAKNTEIATLETSMIEHMNADHADSLMRYCQHFHGLSPSSVRLIGVDCDGFDAEVVIDENIRILRFEFESPIFDANSARLAFAALSKATKA